MTTDMLHTGVAYLDGQRAACMGRPAVYSRGALAVSLAVTLAGEQYQQALDSGLIVRAREIDVILTASELVLGGERATPQPGDRIVCAVDDRVWTLEVADRGGAGHYSAGPFGLHWRIHTQLLSTGEAP